MAAMGVEVSLSGTPIQQDGIAWMELIETSVKGEQGPK